MGGGGGDGGGGRLGGGRGGWARESEVGRPMYEYT